MSPLLRALLRIKPRDVPVRVALRNSVAVVAPLALGIASGHLATGLGMSIGALQTMGSDQPGAYGLRMRRMLLAALVAGLSAALGILIGGYTHLLLVAVFAVGFGGGLMVALGPEAGRIGLTSMLLLLVSANMDMTPAQAPGVAAAIFAGGLLQLLMAVAAWPLQRYRPERFALASILEQLAITARTRPDDKHPAPMLKAAQETLVLLHGQHHTRGIALQSFRIMAEVCERVRVDLLALADIHARLQDPRARGPIEALLEQAARTLDLLAASMREAAPPTRAEDAVARLRGLAPAFEDAQAAAKHPHQQRLLRIAGGRAAGLAGQLRALVRNGQWASSRGQIDAQRAEARLPPALRPGSPLSILKANLRLSSAACRHALRCGTCLVAAVLIARLLDLPHGVWMPMTAAIVLKPDFGATLSFGAGRVLGTLLGLVIGTALIHYAMEGTAVRLLLMWLFCFGFRLTAQMNYVLGVALLTGMVVLLLSFEGMPPGAALQARVMATLYGSALAMLAYGLWPTWEGRGAREGMARLLDADRRHIGLLLAGRIDALDESRSAVRVARTNVQASIDRLRSEPRRGGNRDEARLAEALLANATRLMRAPLSLESLLREGAALPAPPQLAAFAEAADKALDAQVRCLRQQARASEIPPLRAYERELDRALADAGGEVDHALLDAADRIADSVDTLAHLLRHGSAGTPGETAAAGATGGSG